MNKLKINLSCPINTLSYGYVGLNVVKALSKRNDVDLAVLPIGNVEVDNEDDAKLIGELINRPMYRHVGSQKGLFFHPNGVSLRLWHQFNVENRVGRGPHIGFPIFELDKFTELERASLLACDKLFVSSSWAHDIVVRQLEVVPAIVPLGVDTNIFYPNNSKRDTNKPFTILNIGKMEYRKGLDVIGTIVNLAFSPDDNVQLLMAVDNVFLKEEEKKEWHDYYLDTPLGKAGKIKFVPRQRTVNDVANLINSADVGLFPTRAEGWGLPILEMMACGKHVIVTHCTGQSHFCTAENSKPIYVDAAEMERAVDGKWFYGDGEWAKIGERQIEQAVEHLRGLYKEWQNKGELFNGPGVDTANKFTWDNTAEEIVKGCLIQY